MQGFLDPSEILKKLGPQKNMTAADFGSGSGGWVIPLARTLEEGKVFAVDVLEEPLSALRSKAKLEKLVNIETVLADVEKTTRISGQSCDLVLMTNLLFQADDKLSALEEAVRVLKPGGKLLVVDWQKEAPLGQKQGRISAEEVKDMAGNLGLGLKNEFEAGNYHYGLIFLK